MLRAAVVKQQPIYDFKVANRGGAIFHEYFVSGSKGGEKTGRGIGDGANTKRFRTEAPLPRRSVSIGCWFLVGEGVLEEAGDGFVERAAALGASHREGLDAGQPTAVNAIHLEEARPAAEGVLGQHRISEIG